MRKKDLPILLLIVGFSAIFAYVIVGLFISTPKNRQQSVEVAEVMNSSFTIPEDSNFNSNSINPTKLIEIAPNTNGQPFATQQ